MLKAKRTGVFQTVDGVRVRHESRSRPARRTLSDRRDALAPAPSPPCLASSPAGLAESGWVLRQPQCHGPSPSQCDVCLQKEKGEVPDFEPSYEVWGEWFQPTAYRKNVQGVLKFGAPVFWNVRIT
jgi:hypothetical protein